MEESSNSPQSLLEQAMAAHRASRISDADDLYKRAIQEDPRNAQALRLRGILARDSGDLEASRRYLGRAAEVADPADAAPLAELALTAMASDDLDAALRWLRRALARDPEHPRSLANLGALLQYRGHITEAIGCHERVLAFAPRDVEVRCNLARALAEAGRGEEALAACEDGLAFAPAHPLLLAMRGAVLCDLGRYEDAVAALEGATARYPDDDTAWVSLAYARARLGRHDAAIDALKAALRANPYSGRATADTINLLSGTGRGQEALRLGAAYLAAQPGERQVLAALGFAFRDAGRSGEADELLDYERLLRVVELEPAENERLRTLIEADASLIASPASKSTRGGEQTGELDLEADPALRVLHARFGDAVRALATDLAQAGLAAHPAMALAAPAWSIRAWGTALSGGGHQLPHIHPTGWLSGVYYVDVPPDMTTGEAQQAGWLEFGAPPERFFVEKAPRLQAVAPQPGRLVLFPSYFHHRTLPFTAAGRRISIAFDVVPRR